MSFRKAAKSNRNFIVHLYRYFSQIDEDLLQQVLDIYQLDFDLFDYDSSKYNKMVQKNEAKRMIDVNNRLDFGDDAKESRIFS